MFTANTMNITAECEWEVVIFYNGAMLITPADMPIHIEQVAPLLFVNFDLFVHLN